MVERPILFSAPMVRAILAGRKTQTRRVMKPQPTIERAIPRWSPKKGVDINVRDHVDIAAKFSRYGVPGDRLWVRESGNISLDKRAWMYLDFGGALAPGVDQAERHYAREWKSAPSIHMPRWACRLVLEVVEVRVQRLRAITEADAKAEGVETSGDEDPVRAFEHLWRSIHGEWVPETFVWVVSFRRVP